jgi:hypothetical protein
MSDIQLLQQDDLRGKARWDEFVQRHPAATFCHRAGWQRMLADVFKMPTFFLYTAKGSEVTGVLPLAWVKSRWFGSRLTSLPFAVYGGAVADDENDRFVLEAAARDLAHKLGVGYLELRHRGSVGEDPPLYVTFRSDLLPSIDDSMRAIPRKQRTMVRKGMRHGLMSRIERDARNQGESKLAGWLVGLSGVSPLGGTDLLLYGNAAFGIGRAKYSSPQLPSNDVYYQIAEVGVSYPLGGGFSIQLGYRVQNFTFRRVALQTLTASNPPVLLAESHRNIQSTTQGVIMGISASF